MTDKLFFRIFQCEAMDQSELVFDQLDLNSRFDKQTGMPLMQIGEAVVSVDEMVHDDFQIQCYRNDLIESQIGETCCMHTAFIE